MERILVVDDNPDIARMLAQSWLPALGYAPIVAHTAADARNIVQHDRLDLVLLDVTLPDSHDLDHLVAIRRDAPDVPVIMIAPRGAERAVIEAFRLGARDAVFKPFTIEQLRHALDRIVRERRVEREQHQVAAALHEQVQHLMVLNEIGRWITSLSGLDALLPRIVDAAMAVTGADEGFLLLHEEGSSYLSVRAARTATDDRAHVLRLPSDTGAVRTVIETQRPLRIKPTRGDDPLKIRTGYFVRSMLLIPLLSQHDVLGVLGVDNITNKPAFNDVHQHLLSALGDYVVIALQNTQLFEQRLQAEARYRDLFTHASDLLFVLDQHLTIVEVNNAAHRLLGYAPEALVHQSFQQLVVPEAWRHVATQFRQLLDDQRRALHVEADLRTQHGDRRSVEINARTLDAERPHTIFCSARDITQRVQLQAQRIHAAKLTALEQAIAGVAHELNNPLTGIAGYSQLLMRDSTLGAEARTDISRILEQAQRAGKIVQGLLAFGRGAEIVQTAVNMSTLVERGLQLYTTHDWPANVTIERDLAPHLPNVLADPFQLQQVMDNLLTNALRAMRDHGGTLRLRTYSTDTIKMMQHHAFTTPLPVAPITPAIVTEVSDTGIGIPAHQLASIFDPFWTTKAAGEGPGLGLSLCYGIIAKHGGHIWASSAPGQGTTFFIALPPRPRGE